MKLTLCSPPNGPQELQWARGTDLLWYAKASDGTWHRYATDRDDAFVWNHTGGTLGSGGWMRVESLLRLTSDGIGLRRAYWWRELFPALGAAA